MSLSGIAVEPCGILAILFSFSFFFRRITSEPPEVEPRRIGLAQDKAILCHFHSEV